MDLMPLGYVGSQEQIFLGVWGLLSLATTVFWLVMLIDAVRRDFSDSNMKLIWVIILVFTHFLGALVYYVVGRPTGRLR